MAQNLCGEDAVICSDMLVKTHFNNSHIFKGKILSRNVQNIHSLTVKNQVFFRVNNRLCTSGIMAVYCENYNAEHKKVTCQ